MANHPKIPEHMIAQIREMNQQGMSDPQIAHALGYNSEHVRTFRNRWGILPARKPGGQPGAQNAAWTGGKTIDKSGYVLILCPDHPHANSSGYVREHRMVMEQVLGRYLLPTEVVHHTPGVPKDCNDPEFLTVYDKNSDHLREELKGRVPNWTEDGKRRIAAGVAKMADKTRGTKLSEERRAKISAAGKGKPKSPETRAKMSDAAYRRWEREHQQKRTARPSLFGEGSTPDW